MEILVTGASGFVGCQVVRVLARRGHKVHALVRPGSSPWRLNGVPGISMHEGSIDSPEEIRRVIRAARPQSCFHLAWSPSEGTPTSFAHLAFARHSLDLAVALAEAGCEQFVGAGTVFEYDCSSGCLSEQTPLLPQTVYAAAKLAVYTGLKDLERRFPIRTVWVRPFVLYGPFDDSRRLIPLVIRAVQARQPLETTAGSQVRDFLHGEDAAAGICAAAEHKVPLANLGSGRPTSVKHVITTLAMMLDGQELIRMGSLPQRPWEPATVYANNVLLRGTGWQPRFDLETGLRDTILWWSKQTDVK